MWKAVYYIHACIRKQPNIVYSRHDTLFLCVVSHLLLYWGCQCKANCADQSQTRTWSQLEPLWQFALAIAAGCHPAKSAA